MRAHQREPRVSKNILHIDADAFFASVEQDVSDIELVREVLHYLTERIGTKLREEYL